MRGVAIVAAAGLVVACTAPDTGSRASEITAGREAPELDSVVALSTEGSFFCSGTVIAPRVVLTASHCLAPLESDAPIDVVFGARTDAPDELIEVVDRLQHPAWSYDSLVDDVAVVALAERAPVAAVAISRRPLTADDEDRLVTIAGFGATDQQGGGAGVRRSGEAPITGFSDERIWINGGVGAPSVCAGDSGGPSLLTDEGELRVVGVHSRASCSSLSLDERVDRHADGFIDPFVAEHEPGGCSSGGSPGGAAALAVAAALIAVRRQRDSRARAAPTIRARSCTEATGSPGMSSA